MTDYLTIYGREHAPLDDESQLVTDGGRDTVEALKNMIYGDVSLNDEAKIGARWWANCLREPDDVHHDAGDIEINAMANCARDRDSRNEEFNAGKVDEFEKELANRLQEKIEDRRWDYQQPFVGNTTVRCDYHADPVLQDVADEVGLEISSMTTFPIKTTMWLDPGEVKVKTGHSAEIRTVWEIGGHLEEIKDYVSEWVWPVKDDGEIDRCRWTVRGSSCGATPAKKVKVTDATRTCPETFIYVCERHLSEVRDVNYMSIVEVSDVR